MLTRLLCVLAILVALPQEKPPKSYRLPSTDLKQQVIWGSTLEVPDGPSLAFGGQDQKSDDGNPHTRIKVDGQWVPIHEELRKKNPLHGTHLNCVALVSETKRTLARYREGYFDGLLSQPESDRFKKSYTVESEHMARHREWMAEGIRMFEAAAVGLSGYDLEQAKRVIEEARKVSGWMKFGHDFFTDEAIVAASSLLIHCEKMAEGADGEPAPRALSPIAYDARTKLFVIFGGDHLDYLTNDTWVFDPEKRKWLQRHPATAPPPRANHTLKSAEGKITLTGGYTYTSSTDYVGGQYRDLNDGEWTYDVEKNEWSGKGVAPESRTYRTGRLHPEYYQQGPKPDPAAFAATLAALPANTWVATKPPQLPALNRDWGTAVLDPDHDLILRWSGGHSAHGGSDVLQYHMNTNRWELTMPVEFPLGQLYSNTEYPDGWNFNHRPWVTGHTYQSYGYDPNLKKMLFVGRKEHCYVWDPSLGDWESRFAKPKDMVYGDCYYTLTITSTPAGLVCWTQQGKLFRFEKTEWVEIPLKGKLVGSVVDNSTVVYDSKRDRLLFARKPYGDKTEFDGVLQTVDLKTGEAGALAPEGKEKAAGVSYLCQLRYDSTNDLVLAGCTLPEVDGFRRTAAYDCAGNRWVSLKIVGDDPSGKKGRNVSLGLMYDAKRRLFWAVDTNSQVYVLRLDVATADLKPL